MQSAKCVVSGVAFWSLLATPARPLGSRGIFRLRFVGERSSLVDKFSVVRTPRLRPPCLRLSCCVLFSGPRTRAKPFPHKVIASPVRVAFSVVTCCFTLRNVAHRGRQRQC